MNWAINYPPLQNRLQPTGCSPIVDAFLKNKKSVEPWKKKINTIAHGISDALTGYEDDGTQTLKTILLSGGLGVNVSDKEILRAQMYLNQKEGVFAEPAGAAGVAAAIAMNEVRQIKKGDKVVIIITGHGLKNTEQYIKDEKRLFRKKILLEQI